MGFLSALTPNVFRCVNTPHVFLRAPRGGHVGRFHLLAFVNDAATSSGVQISLQDPIPLGLCPGVEVWDPTVVPRLMFETLPCCFPRGCPYLLFCQRCPGTATVLSSLGLGVRAARTVSLPNRKRWL